MSTRLLSLVEHGATLPLPSTVILKQKCFQQSTTVSAELNISSQRLLASKFQTEGLGTENPDDQRCSTCAAA